MSLYDEVDKVRHEELCLRDIIQVVIIPLLDIMLFKQILCEKVILQLEVGLSLKILHDIGIHLWEWLLFPIILQVV